VGQDCTTKPYYVTLHTVRMHTCKKIWIGPTVEGIRTPDTLQVDVAEPTEEPVEDSDFDENKDIMDLEMRNFNDEDGIEEDVYGEIQRRIIFSTSYVDLMLYLNLLDRAGIRQVRSGRELQFKTTWF
jgi:hypothetical protein